MLIEIFFHKWSNIYFNVYLVKSLKIEKYSKNKWQHLIKNIFYLYHTSFKRVLYVNFNSKEITSAAEVERFLIEVKKYFIKLKRIKIFFKSSLNDDFIFLKNLTHIKKMVDSTEIFFTFSEISEWRDWSEDLEYQLNNALKNIRNNIENNFRLVIEINNLNYKILDDINIWSNKNDIKEIIFLPKIKIFLDKKNKTEFFSDFSTEEKFHVLMFFSKLARQQKTYFLRKIYYNSLIKKMSTDFAYTFKNNIFFFKANVISSSDPRKRSGLGKSCDIGIDLRAEKSKNSLFLTWHLTNPSLMDYFYFIIKILKNQKKSLTLPNFDHKFSKIKNSNPIQLNSPKNWKNILITGWYGTETHGDKAILGEILHFIKAHSKDCKITITTINSSISQQTKHELSELANSKIIPIESASKPKNIAKFDAIIIGGGPLMETPQMYNVLKIFAEASRQKKGRIIFGCGIGPIYSENIKKITTQILFYATAGFLRDKESHDYATSLYPEHILEYACDPAIAYVDRWRSKNMKKKLNKELKISTLIRSNTNEFYSKHSNVSLDKANEIFVKKVAQLLNSVSSSEPSAVNLLHMNAHWIGGDDRIFNRQLEKLLSKNCSVNNVRNYLTIESHMTMLSVSDIAIAMRYHGHIFSMALGIPFLSIDYTGKNGKVSNLTQRIHYNRWKKNWEDTDPKESHILLNDIIENRQYISQHLLNQTERLIKELNRTYKKIFSLDTIQDNVD